MKLYQMADPVRYARMTTGELRDTFVVDHLFNTSRIDLAYVDADRAIVGSAVPGRTALVLETQPELRSEYFLERRELGALNVGGPGAITVDGVAYKLGKLDCLYAGRGVKSVTFESDDPGNPAAFYLLSYLAHASYPTAMVHFAALKGLELGALETCNKRTIYKAIYADGIQSCQLVMGFTLLAPGSNWNTMPPHTHMRRSEIYFYFDVDPAHRIIHLMGPPDATKHLILSDRQVVVSPTWSIHSGVGTLNYGFVWGMGGENQAYDDMDPAPITSLR